jgi:CheR methyltransferase, SAM binding domain
VLSTLTGQLARRVWRGIPPQIQTGRLLRPLANAIYRRALVVSTRNQSTSTWFLRNPPLLATLRELADRHERQGSLRICVLGCSTGAEPYSILWTLRKARPDLRISCLAVDLSESSLAKARLGAYSRHDPEMRFMTDESLHNMFDRDGDSYTIKRWISADTQWVSGDVRDEDVVASLGTHDMVLANNFLVHMDTACATDCFRKIMGLTRPRGIFVCRGIDLDLRQRLAREAGLTPLPMNVVEIHDGDALARACWPWDYWGVEPMTKSRPDWLSRYASVFRVAESPASARELISSERVANGAQGL